MIPLRVSQIAFYAAIVTLTVTIATGAGFLFIRSEMLAGNDFLLDAEGEEILARIAPLQSPIDVPKLEGALKEHTQNDEAMFYFQVHTPEGGVIYDSPNLGQLKLPDLTGFAEKHTLRLPGLGLMRVAEFHTPQLHVQIAMSLRNFETVNETFLRVFLLGIPLVAALSIAVGMALRNLTLRPVRRMQATARRITASNLSERLAVPSGSGDLAALAKLLNEMIDRLERSFIQVKRFTADTSHELMTPLSVIRLHAEQLLNDPQLPARNRHAVEELLHETHHMTETLESLLTLAKAESSVLALKLKTHSAQDFIRHFTEDAQVLAESKGMHVVVTQNDSGAVTFDQGWIRQVLFNLFSNAMRHSPPGGTITTRSFFASDRWTVEVQDEGPGVPPDRLEDIFERFVQITPRPEPGSGAGLGLAVCKSIIELHKGRIHARLRTDRSGLVVTFELPTDIIRHDTI